MTDVSSFPQLSEKALKDDQVTAYQGQMNDLYLALVELNCNIYIIERILDFPYRLFDDECVSDGLFFDLMVTNFLQASTLLITKVAKDERSGVISLPALKRRLPQMVKREYQKALNDLLNAIGFDQKTQELLEKAKSIRDTRIAHFDRKPTQDQLTLLEIKALRDELNSLLQALSFDAEYVMLPQVYESQRGDVDWVLDSIAKGSSLLKMAEHDSLRWQHKRKHLSDKDIRELNVYRVKFGLPGV
jgi:hypothetical protein